MRATPLPKLPKLPNLPVPVKRKLHFAKSAVGIFAHAGVGIAARDPLGHAIAFKRKQLGRMLRYERVEGLSYFVGGAGPTLVFIHGFGDQAGSWADTVAMLMRQWRVIVLDLPGHGECEEPERNDMEGQYQGVKRALDLLVPAHERATLIGNSMGGWLSLLYGSRQRERVAHLVLINSAGLLHPVDRALLMPREREMMQAKVAALLGSERTPKLPGLFLDELMRLNTAFLDVLFEELSVSDSFVDEVLPALEIPSTLIWGAQDPIFPPDYAERMAELLPQSELLLEPRWAHAPQMSHPDELAPLLEDILVRQLL